MVTLTNEIFKGDQLSAGKQDRDVVSTVTLKNTINGYVVTDFEGGYLKSFFARVDPFGTVTGSAVAAIYIDKTLVEISDEFTFSSFSGSDYWHEFTFSDDLLIPSGELSLVVYSDADLYIERDSGVSPAEDWISISRTYDGSLPNTITFAGATSAPRMLYIDYYSHKTMVNNLSTTSPSMNNINTNWYWSEVINFSYNLSSAGGWGDYFGDTDSVDADGQTSDGTGIAYFYSGNDPSYDFHQINPPTTQATEEYIFSIKYNGLDAADLIGVGMRTEAGSWTDSAQGETNVYLIDGLGITGAVRKVKLSINHKRNTNGTWFIDKLTYQFLIDPNYLTNL